MDNWIAPLFQTASLDNHSFYSNKVIDDGIIAARGIGDTAARIAAYQEMERTIGADAPVAPVVFYAHKAVCSDRIEGLIDSPMNYFNFDQVRILSK